jgi:hypothetical protein
MFDVSDLSTEVFWAKLSTETGADGERKFGKLCDFVFAVLSLPISNASVERAFSVMGVVKSKLRNRLLIETTAAVLKIRYGLLRRGETCKNFEPPKRMYDLFDNSIYETPVASEQGNEEDVDGVFDIISHSF